MPAKPSARPTSALAREALAVRQQPLDQRRPERRGRNQHRGQPARHVLLRADHEAVADDVHQEAEQHERAPQARGRGRRRPLASTMPHSSTPAAIQRRPATSSTGTVSSATLIAEVGRAPDEAHRDEREIRELHGSRSPSAPHARRDIFSFGIAIRGSSFTVSSTIVVLRRDHTRRRRNLLPQQLAQVLRVARAHLQQVTIVAGHVMHFEHFGDLLTARSPTACPARARRSAPPQTPAGRGRQRGGRLARRNP